MKGNLEKLKEELKIKNKEAYEEACDLILFLSKKRIKLLGNDIRKSIGRPINDVDKNEIIATVHKLNKLAESNAIEFNIPNNWEYVEKFLKVTIVEDIGKEMERQKK